MGDAVGARRDVNGFSGRAANGNAPPDRRNRGPAPGEPPSAIQVGPGTRRELFCFLKNWTPSPAPLASRSVCKLRPPVASTQVESFVAACFTVPPPACPPVLGTVPIWEVPPRQPAPGSAPRLKNHPSRSDLSTITDQSCPRLTFSFFCDFRSSSLPTAQVRPSFDDANISSASRHIYHRPAPSQSIVSPRSGV